MATIAKRKANDIASNGLYQNDRPILKRRDTSVSGFQNLSLNGNEYQQEQQQYDARTQNELPWIQDATSLPTPPNSATLPQEDELMDDDDDTTPLPYKSFQDQFTTFCQRHQHSFGPAHRSDLERCYQRAINASEPGGVLAAGQAFKEILDQYISDLQAMALQQVQLRITMARIGVEKAALEAVDVVLAKLDQQIIVMGAEAQNLEFEVDSLERQLAGR